MIFLIVCYKFTWIFFEGGALVGIVHPYQLVSSRSVQIVHFEVGAFSPIATCLLSRKNIFSVIFHNNLNIFFVHTFPVELECTTYHLSPNAFSCVNSTLFLQVECLDKVNILRLKDFYINSLHKCTCFGIVEYICYVYMLYMLCIYMYFHINVYTTYVLLHELLHKHLRKILLLFMI